MACHLEEFPVIAADLLSKVSNRAVRTEEAVDGKLFYPRFNRALKQALEEIKGDTRESYEERLFTLTSALTTFSHIRRFLLHSPKAESCIGLIFRRLAAQMLKDEYLLDNGSIVDGIKSVYLTYLPEAAEQLKNYPDELKYVQCLQRLERNGWSRPLLGQILEDRVAEEREAISYIENEEIDDLLKLRILELLRHEGRESAALNLAHWCTRSASMADDVQLLTVQFELLYKDMNENNERFWDLVRGMTCCTVKKFINAHVSHSGISADAYKRTPDVNCVNVITSSTTSGNSVVISTENFMTDGFSASWNSTVISAGNSMTPEIFTSASSSSTPGNPVTTFFGNSPSKSASASTSATTVKSDMEGVMTPASSNPMSAESSPVVVEEVLIVEGEGGRRPVAPLIPNADRRFMDPTIQREDLWFLEVVRRCAVIMWEDATAHRECVRKALSAWLPMERWYCVNESDGSRLSCDDDCNDEDDYDDDRTVDEFHWVLKTLVKKHACREFVIELLDLIEIMYGVEYLGLCYRAAFEGLVWERSRLRHAVALYHNDNEEIEATQNVIQLLNILSRLFKFILPTLHLSCLVSKFYLDPTVESFRSVQSLSSFVDSLHCTDTSAFPLQHIPSSLNRERITCLMLSVEGTRPNTITLMRGWLTLRKYLIKHLALKTGIKYSYKMDRFNDPSKKTHTKRRKKNEVKVENGVSMEGVKYEVSQIKTEVQSDDSMCEHEEEDAFSAETVGENADIKLELSDHISEAIFPPSAQEDLISEIVNSPSSWLDTIIESGPRVEPVNEADMNVVSQHDEGYKPESSELYSEECLTHREILTVVESTNLAESASIDSVEGNKDKYSLFEQILSTAESKQFVSSASNVTQDSVSPISSITSQAIEYITPPVTDKVSQLRSSEHKASILDSFNTTTHVTGYSDSSVSNAVLQLRSCERKSSILDSFASETMLSVSSVTQHTGLVAPAVSRQTCDESRIGQQMESFLTSISMHGIFKDIRIEKSLSNTGLGEHVSGYTNASRQSDTLSLYGERGPIMHTGFDNVVSSGSPSKPNVYYGVNAAVSTCNTAEVSQYLPSALTDVPSSVNVMHTGFNSGSALSAESSNKPNVYCGVNATISTCNTAEVSEYISSACIGVPSSTTTCSRNTNVRQFVDIQHLLKGLETSSSSNIDKLPVLHAISIQQQTKPDSCQNFNIGAVSLAMSSEEDQNISNDKPFDLSLPKICKHEQSVQESSSVRSCQEMLRSDTTEGRPNLITSPKNSVYLGNIMVRLPLSTTATNSDRASVTCRALQRNDSISLTSGNSVGQNIGQASNNVGHASSNIGNNSNLGHANSDLGHVEKTPSTVESPLNRLMAPGSSTAILAMLRALIATSQSSGKIDESSISGKIDESLSSRSLIEYQQTSEINAPDRAADYLKGRELSGDCNERLNLCGVNESTQIQSNSETKYTGGLCTKPDQFSGAQCRERFSGSGERLRKDCSNMSAVTTGSGDMDNQIWYQPDISQDNSEMISHITTAGDLNPDSFFISSNIIEAKEETVTTRTNNKSKKISSKANQSVTPLKKRKLKKCNDEIVKGDLGMLDTNSHQLYDSREAAATTAAATSNVVKQASQASDVFSSLYQREQVDGASRDMCYNGSDEVMVRIPVYVRASTESHVSTSSYQASACIDRIPKLRGLNDIVSADQRHIGSYNIQKAAACGSNTASMYPICSGSGETSHSLTSPEAVTATITSASSNAPSNDFCSILESYQRAAKPLKKVDPSSEATGIVAKLKLSTNRDVETNYMNISELINSSNSVSQNVTTNNANEFCIVNDFSISGCDLDNNRLDLIERPICGAPDIREKCDSVDSISSTSVNPTGVLSSYEDRLNDGNSMSIESVKSSTSIDTCVTDSSSATELYALTISSSSSINILSTDQSSSSISSRSTSISSTSTISSSILSADQSSSSSTSSSTSISSTSTISSSTLSTDQSNEQDSESLDVIDCNTNNIDKVNISSKEEVGSITDVDRNVTSSVHNSSLDQTTKTSSDLSKLNIRKSAATTPATLSSVVSMSKITPRQPKNVIAPKFKTPEVGERKIVPSGKLSVTPRSVTRTPSSSNSAGKYRYECRLCVSRRFPSFYHLYQHSTKDHGVECRRLNDDTAAPLIGFFCRLCAQEINVQSWHSVDEWTCPCASPDTSLSIESCSSRSSIESKSSSSLMEVGIKNRAGSKSSPSRKTRKSEGKKCVCDLCNRTVKEFSTIKSHCLRDHHVICTIYSVGDEDIKSSQKRYMCKECGRVIDVVEWVKAISWVCACEQRKEFKNFNKTPKGSNTSAMMKQGSAAVQASSSKEKETAVNSDKQRKRLAKSSECIKASKRRSVENVKMELDEIEVKDKKASLEIVTKESSSAKVSITQSKIESKNSERISTPTRKDVVMVRLNASKLKRLNVKKVESGVKLHSEKKDKEENVGRSVVKLSADPMNISTECSGSVKSLNLSKNSANDRKEKDTKKTEVIRDKSTGSKIKVENISTAAMKKSIKENPLRAKKVLTKQAECTNVERRNNRKKVSSANRIPEKQQKFKKLRMNPDLLMIQESFDYNTSDSRRTDVLVKDTKSTECNDEPTGCLSEQKKTTRVSSKSTSFILNARLRNICDRRVVNKVSSSTSVKSEAGSSVNSSTSCESLDNNSARVSLTEAELVERFGFGKEYKMRNRKADISYRTVYIKRKITSPVKHRINPSAILKRKYFMRKRAIVKPVVRKIATRSVSSDKVITTKPVADEKSISKGVVGEKLTIAKPVLSDTAIISKPTTSDRSIMSLPTVSDSSVVSKSSTVSDKSIVSRPTTGDRSIVSKPTTSDRSIMSLPTVSDSSVVSKSSTVSDKSIVSRPTTGDRSIVSKLTTSDRSIVSRPTVSDSSVVSKPTVDKFIVSKSTIDKLIVSKSTVDKLIVSKPTASDKSIVSKPTNTDRSIITKAIVGDRSVMSKPAVSDKLVISKPTVAAKSVESKTVVKSSVSKPVISEKCTAAIAVISEKLTRNNSAVGEKLRSADVKLDKPESAWMTVGKNLIASLNNEKLSQKSECVKNVKQEDQKLEEKGKKKEMQQRKDGQANNVCKIGKSAESLVCDERSEDSKGDTSEIIDVCSNSNDNTEILGFSGALEKDISCKTEVQTLKKNSKPASKAVQKKSELVGAKKNNLEAKMTKSEKLLLCKILEEGLKNTCDKNDLNMAPLALERRESFNTDESSVDVEAISISSSSDASDDVKITSAFDASGKQLTKLTSVAFTGKQGVKNSSDNALVHNAKATALRSKRAASTESNTPSKFACTSILVSSKSQKGKAIASKASPVVDLGCRTNVSMTCGTSKIFFSGSLPGSLPVLRRLSSEKAEKTVSSEDATSDLPAPSESLSSCVIGSAELNDWMNSEKTELNLNSRDPFHNTIRPSGAGKPDEAINPTSAESSKITTSALSSKTTRVGIGFTVNPSLIKDCRQRVLKLSETVIQSSTVTKQNASSENSQRCPTLSPCAVVKHVGQATIVNMGHSAATKLGQSSGQQSEAGCTSVTSSRVVGQAVVRRRTLAKDASEIYDLASEKWDTKKPRSK